MYTLLDGKRQNQLHPDTFELPTIDEIRELKVGNFVKLCFEEEAKNGERMWVRLTMIENDSFTGILDNDPFALETIQFNDTVVFHSNHIIGILNETE